MQFLFYNLFYHHQNETVQLVCIFSYIRVIYTYLFM